MRSASSQEIKQELKKMNAPALVDICLRLARFKKENKELLTFLLFEADDIESYIRSSKEEIDTAFAGMNVSHVYYAKKTIRKILRDTNRYIRYSGNRQVEAELLLHFCRRLQESGLNLKRAPAIFKILLSQVKKINAAISSLHEDLRYDYQRQLDALIDD